MFILPNIMDIFHIIHKKDVETYKKCESFRIFSNILRTPEYCNIPVGVPYWILFEDKKMIDVVVMFEDMNNIKYCSALECFVFKDIIHAILGIRAIYMLLQCSDVTNVKYKESVCMINDVIEKIDNENVMRDICTNVNAIHINRN